MSGNGSGPAHWEQGGCGPGGCDGPPPGPGASGTCWTVLANFKCTGGGRGRCLRERHTRATHSLPCRGGEQAPGGRAHLPCPASAGLRPAAVLPALSPQPNWLHSQAGGLAHLAGEEAQPRAQRARRGRQAARPAHTQVGGSRPAACAPQPPKRSWSRFGKQDQPQGSHHLL